jgi:ATP-dependent DNA ligase
MDLRVTPPHLPMEARSVSDIPISNGWIYEPKWDGFRCLVFVDGEKVFLQSKSGQPLTRYFPEIVEALRKVKSNKFVLDCELVIESNGHLDFNALLQRIHPAVSRVQRLSEETPSMLLCFDVLALDQESFLEIPLSSRKNLLSGFFRENVPVSLKNSICQSPASQDPQDALRWISELATYGCDGIVAKLKDEPYHTGDREAMVKVKRIRTADCVIGGFRYAQKKQNGVGSILLGLYNDLGALDHVGYSSSFSAEQRKDLLLKLLPLVAAPGFTGKAPGGPSRWTRNNERSTQWEPLRPELVCEVQYDHFSNGRFRHGTKFLRWRPDKAPLSCTYEQLKPAVPARAKQKLAS